MRLDVQDNGPGFEPQIAERLFQPFFTTKRDGMGIGLSVSRSIVEGHHGRLWAAPNDGPGAKFSFSISRASARRSVVLNGPPVAANGLQISRAAKNNFEYIRYSLMIE